MTTATITADAAPVETTRHQSAFSRFTRAILRNRKATGGAVILLILVILAIFPGVFARDDPQAAIYGQDLGPSAQHLLGTTQLGQW
jgi:peptide/nickel transport system permease protein